MPFFLERERESERGQTPTNSIDGEFGVVQEFTIVKICVI